MRCAAVDLGGTPDNGLSSPTPVDVNGDNVVDYVYAGGKNPYGAPPAQSPANPNPPQVGADAGAGDPAFKLNEAPHAFKVNINATDPSTLAVGEDVTFTGSAGVGSVVGKYIGKSRIDGFSMFKTGAFTTATNLGEVFNGDVGVAGTGVVDGSVGTYPSLISTLEDQVQGFTGAGPQDKENWQGTFVDGNQLYEPMERGVGEMTYPRALGLTVFTKFVQVGTYQVSVSVTQEQIQDLNKQWGIDVIAMVENAGINEISQSINKHILSRVFGLGWKNHIAANNVEAVNLNLDMTSVTDSVSPVYAYPGGEGDAGVDQHASMAVIGYKQVPTTAGSQFENEDTAIKRIMARILAAGNVVMQRGRRGPANFIVTNVKLATALQTNSQYAFSPIANTFNQNNGSLYPLGTIGGMTLYVDPNMIYEDTRCLVGRKGASDEPGTVFCPYLMAESVKLITEGTGAPKVIVKSRYALVDAGWHPETQYVTLYIKTNPGALI